MARIPKYCDERTPLILGAIDAADDDSNNGEPRGKIETGFSWDEYIIANYFTAPYARGSNLARISELLSWGRGWLQLIVSQLLTGNSGNQSPVRPIGRIKALFENGLSPDGSPPLPEL